MKLDAALHKLRDTYFERLHGGNLVYNACWEDPACDREILQLNDQSRVVMITSAGCNALDYLLDGPKSIDCIDVNPRQNALLELKIALMQHGSHDVLFRFFGHGWFDSAYDYYEIALRKHLSESARLFWDEKIYYYFNDPEKAFYFFGTSGKFAWYFKKYLKARPKVRALVNQLLTAQTLEEQQAIYAQLEPKLMNKLVKWMMNRHSVLSLLGVPRQQRNLITTQFKGGVAEYISMSLKHVFTTIPISNNYFWYVYIKGAYARNNCPNYLLKENFDFYSFYSDRIKTHTSTVSQFLEKNPGQYSHFVLLDHQDWLAMYDHDALEKEWDLILKNAATGAKILMRSASSDLFFIPENAKGRLKIITEGLDAWKAKDRVGTYAGLFVAEVL